VIDNIFKGLLLATIFTTLGASTTLSADTAEPRSPCNQLYQFAVTGGRDISQAYLWIPEDCTKLRGLLILSENVPECLIAGHPAIRKACADNQLGILYTTLGFWPYDGEPKDATDAERIEHLQALLNKLAEKSGYPEVATVPWLPIGESMMLDMVRGLVDEKPERCMAGIFSNDIGYRNNRSVPILAFQGTAGEWTQTKGDLRSSWKNTGRYPAACAERGKSPEWPASFVVEPGGGHFNCSEQILQYYALYIDRVAKARLSDDGSPSLKPVDLDSGFLARLPVDGTPQPIEPARGASDTARPWFFDRESAERAQAMANVNWNAETQLPTVLAGDHCVVKPWSHNSVTEVDVSTDSEFSLQPVLLDQFPAEFVTAGQPLAKSTHTPAIEWLRGLAAPLGNNRFCVELDRNYKNPKYLVPPCLMVAVQGDGKTRYSVQPVMVHLIENASGAPQTLDFKKINDVPVGTISVPLEAQASSGRPVKFFVEAGPALVEKNELRFTKMPPRTRFPVEVTVTAWQWGTCDAPLFQKALSSQTFYIVKP